MESELSWNDDFVLGISVMRTVVMGQIDPLLAEDVAELIDGLLFAGATSGFVREPGCLDFMG